MILQPGTNILDGKYRVDAFAGQGASAEVYLVTHLALKARRAIKVLRRDDSDGPSAGAGVGSTGFDDFRRRFELEAQLGAQLNSPNIIQVYDFVEQDPRTLMLVMEYAAGGSLAERLAKLRGASVSPSVMPISEAVGIALDVASGLAVLHGRDTVHRDLKPSNILFDADGHAKVADLGLSQVPGGQSMRSLISAAQPHPGTPAYMSPEQTDSRAYLTSASDIYALGLVMFEMLTGRAYKNMRPGTRAGTLRLDVPSALDDLVVRMLSKDAESRPFDGAEVSLLVRAIGIAPTWNRDEALLRKRAETEAAALLTAQDQRARQQADEARKAKESAEQAAREQAARQAADEARQKAEAQQAKVLAEQRVKDEVAKQEEAARQKANELARQKAEEERLVQDEAARLKLAGQVESQKRQSTAPSNPRRTRTIVVGLLIAGAVVICSILLIVSQLGGFVAPAPPPSASCPYMASAGLLVPNVESALFNLNGVSYKIRVNTATNSIDVWDSYTNIITEDPSPAYFQQRNQWVRVNHPTGVASPFVVCVDTTGNVYASFNP